jgi:O-antigen/teichoic acid export membrane protein
MASHINLDRSRIFANIATLLSGSVIAQIMTAFALLFTARQLNADVYGQYAACIALTSLASIFFSMGLDIWLLREGGRANYLLAELTGSVLGIKVIFGIIWMVLFALIIPLLNQDTYPIKLMLWSVLLIWIDTLLATTLTGFKAALHNKLPAILEAVADSIWFGLTILLVLWGVDQPEKYIMIRVGVSSIVLLVAVFLLERNVGLHIDRKLAKHALRSAFPFASSDFLAMITMRADVVIISITIGKTATGLYSPAVGLVNMAFLAPMAIYMVMLPVLSNLYKHYPQQAHKTARRTIYLSLLVGIGLTLIYFFGAPLLPKLLGQSYMDSVSVLKILSLVLLFKCGSFAFATIMVATNQQAKRTLIQVIAASVNIILNLLIVINYGINGVAFVYVITEIVLFVGYSWYVWRTR